MNNHFTGAQLKAMAKTKNIKDIVVRLNGCYQTVEFSNDDITGKISVKAEIKTDAKSKDDCFIDLYCFQSPSPVVSFIASIKAKDEIQFYTEDHTPIESGEKYGFKITHVLARVKRNNKILAFFITSEYRNI
jgi:hypothetical protein